MKGYLLRIGFDATPLLGGWADRYIQPWLFGRCGPACALLPGDGRCSHRAREVSLVKDIRQCHVASDNIEIIPHADIDRDRAWLRHGACEEPGEDRDVGIAEKTLANIIDSGSQLKCRARYIIACKERGLMARRQYPVFPQGEYRPRSAPGARRLQGS